MRSGNRIAIVGAGIAGLVCAKVLSEDGFAVEVFDRAPDIGGVWSETRRYPGLRAQSSKYTYHFSDHPMPADYPRVLDGARMQEYLASYVRAFGLTDRLRLRTEVVAADPVDGGWLLEIRDLDGVHRTSCDHLVIANGVFSEPQLPDFAGMTEFGRAGGQLGHSTQFLDVDAVRDRSVVVVGYGAAACDLATEISRVAAETTVVARRLLWKMPRRLAPGLDAERVLLTRTGAAHFRHPEPGRFERLLRGPGRSFRESNLDLVEALVAQRSRAAELGLVPPVRFEQAHEAAFGLAADDFADQVAAGRITVCGGTEVAALGGGQAGPYAELSDGRLVRADIVVCATGFQQRVPFLTPYVQRQLTDDHGNFRLYRQILPLEVPHLTFAGYNSSLLSAVGAEVGAHWTSALLTRSLSLPPAETMSERIEARLRWMHEYTDGHHAHGASVTPYALRDIDELLADLGVKLPLAARAAQWVRPARPGDYKVLSRRKRGSAGRPLGSAPYSAPSPQPQLQSAQPRPASPPAGATEPIHTGAARPDSSAGHPVASESPTVQLPESALPGADERTRILAMPAAHPAGPDSQPAPGKPPQPVPASRAAPVNTRWPVNAPQPPNTPPLENAATPPDGQPANTPPAAPQQSAVDIARDAARRAAAEKRAAGIAARSNSPTVRLDMRAAQAQAQAQAAAAASADTSAPPVGEPETPAGAPADAQSAATAESATGQGAVPETATPPSESAEPAPATGTAEARSVATDPASAGATESVPATDPAPGPADPVSTGKADQAPASGTPDPASAGKTDQAPASGTPDPASAGKTDQPLASGTPDPASAGKTDQPLASGTPDPASAGGTDRAPASAPADPAAAEHTGGMPATGATGSASAAGSETPGTATAGSVSASPEPEAQASGASSRT
ncbi:flavin-containing monooxygenase [Nocardia testacea]|uniref:flavin-containing monooxygenase n=1 Tax=Nocardia testacea TaxID=248551 RepID=UPI00340E02CD